MKNVFIFILSFQIFTQAYSQIPVGKWRSHLPFSSASKVAKAESKVYCATSGGLFYFNTDDNSVNKVSKEDGLSDSDITALGYSKESQTLIICYQSGNIDLILNNTIFNIPDIKDKLFPGNKRINNIRINDGTAYLACGFGIIVLNIVRKEISETYYFGAGGTQIKINEICFDSQNIYAATDRGIYFASRTSPNLLDFNSWSKDITIPHSNEAFNTITTVAGRVFANFSSGIKEGDIVYYREGGVWIKYPNFNNDNCQQLTTWNNNIIILGYFHVDIYDLNGSNLKHIFFGQPQTATMDEDGILWVADAVGGLIRNNDEYTLLKLSPNGPAQIFVSGIAIKDNTLYAVPGGKDSGQGNLYRPSGVFAFKSNNWTNWNVESARDFYKIAIDPVNPEHYFVASWGYGLFEFENGELKNKFKDNNSTLQTIIAGEDYYRLGGLTFDNSGNLWVTNSGVDKPVSIMKKNGEWISYSLNNIVNSYLFDIVETSSGHKWINMASGRGLMVIDDNSTIDNPEDDLYKRLDVVDENNRLITNEIYSIAEDKEGYLWLGTNKGILVYYNPSKVFTSENFYAKPIIVPRNDGTNNGDLLLGTESVTCIAVDGANRKWLGTKNAGVFLVSDDGIKQIHNFNSENSPLLSNSISAIAINDKTGEVFFGTEKGIISYRSEATEPSDQFNDVYVYPNPVREDYSGDIVITGLVKDTHVKITDLTGNLVYETLAVGGQAVWNGKNYNDKRVSTGVYLVFCSNQDGTLTHITKILFIH